MSSVSSSGEHNVGKLIDGIISKNDAAEKTAAKIGSQMTEVEDDLSAAYSVGKDSEELKKLAKKYGLGADATPEALQQVVNQKFNKMMRAFNAFEAIMKAMHEMMMSIIRNIGR